MTGVNDTKTVAFWKGEGACIDHDLEAADAMQELARTAWHPVSEPPTEADATEFGMVLMRDNRYPLEVWVERYGLVKATGPVDYVEWARIRDVVLLPPA